MNKTEIRAKNLLLRKNLNKKTASDTIVSKILSSDEFLSALNILIYYPLKFEINLLALLNVKDKNFYLPRVFEEKLLICPYTTKLEKSSFGVLEPLIEPILDISIIDVVYVPCLSIDKEMNRVGYGKGFYDRLFRDSNFRAKKIAVLYKELLVDKIETCSFDMKVDKVITD